MSKVQKQIEKLEAELEKLKEIRRKEESRPLDVQMAYRLHELFCTANHVDGCGWDYDSDDCFFTRPNSVKGRYLQKAHDLMVRGITIEDVQRAAELVDECKKPY